MTDQPLLTTRETIASILNNHPTLLALGLAEDSVLQADTISSPKSKPFIVIRWMDEQPGIGPVSLRPFDLWNYDEEGDYSRLDRIGKAAAEILMDVIAMPTESGFISQIRGRATPANPGLGRGADLYDEGYKCVVVPWRLAAVATGV